MTVKFLPSAVGLLFLVLFSSPRAAVTAPSAIAVYSHAPGTVVDPRVAARVGGGSVSHTLAVEDAPPTPQTRDPGYGRPPFTSSRLRLATGQGISTVRVALRCLGESCSFGKGAVLRGVHFDGHVDYAKRELVFQLPAPAPGQQAAHYYLKVVVHNASGAPHFARGQLFYFWLDNQQEPPMLRPNNNAADVTTLGVVANSSALQTGAIQRLLDNATLPRLYFPGPALYATGSLLVRRPMAIELGEGATLQHPSPREKKRRLRPVENVSTHCVSAAFLTISANEVYIGGRGGTFDANGFDGHNICIAGATNVTLQHVLLRGSASWSTHIFRSRSVVVEGVKIFSGADGVDPDSSHDVLLRSIFVHSNDDAIAVKTTAAGHNTERIVCEQALLSTKKSCVKVGTESLSDFDRVRFSDVEGFNLDRGLVLYPSDGGRLANIAFERIRLSSFYPYADERRDGAVLDFESKNRSGLSQLWNVSVENVVATRVTGSSILKGVAGAKIDNIIVRNLTLVVGKPNNNRTSYLFECNGFVDPVTVEGLHVEWGQSRPYWAGLQSHQNCLRQGQV